jgi:hypothetical protein
MQTFSSREVQTRWGAVTDIAKREPVMVTQYGRESVMIVSAEIGREVLRLQVEGKRAARKPARKAPLGMLDFLKQARASAPRSRAAIDEALGRDRDAWEK